MKSKTAQLEFRAPAILGEGALWDAESQRLYWVDILGRQVASYDPVRKVNRARSFDADIGTVVLTESGKWLLATSRGFVAVDPESGDETPLGDPESHIATNRFNDGKCDPAGRLWAGTMGYDAGEGKGALYCLDEAQEISTKLPSVSISNGLVWSKDGTSFFYIDTPTGVVQKFAYDQASGKITDPQVHAKLPEGIGYPDGMAIDDKGDLWVALWEGAAVIRIDGSTGDIIEKIELPVSHVTSCALGGAERKTLYITTARVGLSEDQLDKEPLAGSLFSVEVETPGPGARRYAAL